MFVHTAWCSEIGSRTSLDAPEFHASMHMTLENQFHCSRLSTYVGVPRNYRATVDSLICVLQLRTLVDKDVHAMFLKKVADFGAQKVDGFIWCTHVRPKLIKNPFF